MENIVIDNVFVWMAKVGVVRRLRCFLLIICVYPMKFMTCSFDFHEPSEISLELSFCCLFYELHAQTVVE